MYRFRVPGDVGELPAGSGDEIEDEDNEDNERTDDSPCGLPEDIGFVSNHELNVFIKPVRKKKQ